MNANRPILFDAFVLALFALLLWQKAIPLEMFYGVASAIVAATFALRSPTGGTGAGPGALGAVFLGIVSLGLRGAAVLALVVASAGVFATGCSGGALPPGTSVKVTGPDGVSASAHGAWIPNPAPSTFITNNYGCGALDAGGEQ